MSVCPWPVALELEDLETEVEVPVVSMILNYSQEEFWRPTSKYLGHCGSGWHPYLPIVVMGHPKSPAMSWFGEAKLTPDGSLMENPPAPKSPFRRVFLHMFLWCSHVFFPFPSPFREDFPMKTSIHWRCSYVVHMIFPWFSYIFPSADRDGLGMGGLCPVESHTTPGGGELKGKIFGKPNWFVILGKL